MARIVIGMAVLPERIEAAINAAYSLEQQSVEPDRILCVIDDTSGPVETEEWGRLEASVDTVYCVLASDIRNKFGDAGKFYVCSQEPNAIVLTCDDDLIYPPDYIERTVAAIDEYGGAAAVGYHGAKFTKRLESYYRCGPAGGKMQYHCLGDVPRRVPVHLLGTGVLGFWNDAEYRLWPQAFGSRNMADIWFARFCQRREIPMVCLEHKKGWLMHSEKVDKAKTIYRDNRWNDVQQTRLVNDYMPWRLHPAKVVA